MPNERQKPQAIARRRPKHTPLIALNAGLVALLAVVTFGTPAPAQANRQQPGEYVLLPLDVQGSSTDMLVIADSLNGRLAVAAWDAGRRSLRPADARDIAEDARRAGARGGDR